MCGIAGIVVPAAGRYARQIKQMTDCVSHRGPDGEGEHYFENCGLGHRRLSIVDLGTGQQPMLSGSGTCGITFNGEIYGYQEIRPSLTDYPFRTTSDTEVILALYREHGCKLLEHLPGVFAFALWDEVQQELFCARDRFGEKPFYYAVGSKGEFIFASEIKAIIASGLVTPVLNPEAVSHYLKYLYVHPSQTIYRNILTLPPAHSLRYRNGLIEVERYWVMPENQGEIGIVEATEEFRRLLDQAVARQLVADVPVGAFLSGGLDSSTIVACATRHQSQLKTFSFGFTEAVSELPYAREVADFYGTDHTELMDQGADIADLLFTMQEIYDEPFADSSNIPTYLMSKLAREHVKVVLTGDGGDELFGGYAWYKPLLAVQNRAHCPSGAVLLMLRAALKLAERFGLPNEHPLRSRIHGQKLARHYSSVCQAHQAQRAYFSDKELVRLGVGLPRPCDERESYSSVDGAMRMDVADYMPGDILVKIDRASMSQGLELRAPFLDKDFASFCLSLPYQLKLNETDDKIILRSGFAKQWPESVKSRTKLGFGAPVSRWLKYPSVVVLKNQYLGNPRSKIFSLLQYDAVASFAAKDDYRTWVLLVLALWIEKHAPEMGN
jgi:asparagine synthase (glutamine-hydrolysing)